MEDDRFYRKLCSMETLQSGSKGFFQEFSNAVVDEVGDAWITKVFGKANSDEERIRIIFTDKKIKDVVLDTLSRVQELYRDKSADISLKRRMEGITENVTGNYEKSLLLLSQAVLRAPPTGKVKNIDQGLSLSLALFARADTLMALNEFQLALQDLRSAEKEGLPDSLRAKLYWKIGNCQRTLGCREKARISLSLAEKLLPAERVTERRELMKDMDRLNFDEPLEKPDVTDKEGKPPVILSGGANATFPGASRLLTVKETQDAGRHAIATDEIHPGDTLATEPPLAACLLPEFYGSHCHHCFTRLRAPVGCNTCSSVAFCSTSCRDIALSTYHKYECKIIALMIGSGMSILSTVAFRMVTQEGLERCLEICKRIKVGQIDINEVNEECRTKSDEKSAIGKSAKRRLRKKKLKEAAEKSAEDLTDFTRKDLDEEQKERRVDLRAYQLVTLAKQRSAEDFLRRTLMATFHLKCLQKFAKNAILSKSHVAFHKITEIYEAPSHEELLVGSLLLRNLQLLQFNAHEVFETRLGNEHRFRGSKTIYIGVAIYPTVAFFNHDCYPAVTRYFSGRNIVIRAVRPLKVGDVVAENYGPIFTKRSLAERQRSLTGRYWFKCSCRACYEDWPGFKNLTNDYARLRCPSEGCTRLLAQPREPKKPVKCPGCQKKVNLEDRLNKLRECELDYAQGLAIMEAERVDDAVQALAETLEKFHKIASPPHRDTHLAEVALAACMADSGNTWKPTNSGGGGLQLALL